MDNYEGYYNLVFIGLVFISIFWLVFAYLLDFRKEKIRKRGL